MRGRGRGHDGLLLQKLKLFDSSECDASRLFALHHVLERRARAERRIIGRRNLQRRTRGRVTSLARGARLSGKRAKLGDGHLVARANGRADLIERRRQHASDVRLRLTRLRRHGIDESLLVQSRRRVSPTIESRRVHSSVVASRAPSRRNLKTRRRPITALDRASHRAAPPPRTLRSSSRSRATIFPSSVPRGRAVSSLTHPPVVVIIFPAHLNDDTARPLDVDDLGVGARPAPGDDARRRRARGGQHISRSARSFVRSFVRARGGV